MNSFEKEISNGNPIQISFQDIKRISVEVNESGPFSDDFFVKIYTDSACFSISNGNPDATHIIFEVIPKIVPDNICENLYSAIIEMASCTHENSIIVYESKIQQKTFNPGKTIIG